MVDSIRTWTTLTEQLTRTLRFPIPEVDVAGIVDRAFDAAEQTLAAHHQLARTLAGVATRHVDIAVGSVDTVAAAVEATVDATPAESRTSSKSPGLSRERAGELEIDGRSSMNKEELIAALRNHRRSRSARTDAPKSQSPRQDRTPDRRSV